ncbi:hypothetical protein D3C71_2003800 [compost metagenome]
MIVLVIMPDMIIIVLNAAMIIEEIDQIIENRKKEMIKGTMIAARIGVRGMAEDKG